MVLLGDYNLSGIIQGTENSSLGVLFALQPKTSQFQTDINFRNPTEKAWSDHNGSFPLTGVPTESLMALNKFILPSITKEMVVKELGCWNAEALIRLSVESSKKNINLKRLSGIDLNKMALECGENLIDYFGMKKISLVHGNVVDSSFLKNDFAEPQIVLAFRLLPTFDEETIFLLFSNIQQYFMMINMLFSKLTFLQRILSKY
jgi:hypothetical protein